MMKSSLLRISGIPVFELKEPLLNICDTFKFQLINMKFLCLFYRILKTVEAIVRYPIRKQYQTVEELPNL